MRVIGPLAGLAASHNVASRAVEAISEINYCAVLLATVSSMAVGAIWMDHGRVPGRAQSPWTGKSG
ncbi:MAG TPA: hypothetical protein VEX12_11150, partial [Microbacterium sp.]|nr:hypothetical protein [Microbacterium sp.]